MSSSTHSSHYQIVFIFIWLMHHTPLFTASTSKTCIGLGLMPPMSCIYAILLRLPARVGLQTISGVTGCASRQSVAAAGGNPVGAAVQIADKTTQYTRIHKNSSIAWTPIVIVTQSASLNIPTNNTMPSMLIPGYPRVCTY